jgi:hypothetical protein
MISLKDWMAVVSYRISEGSNYCWHCFGPNAYMLDAWDGKQEGVSACVIFDTKTQEVYEVSVCDFKKEKAYRYTNPNFLKAFKAEVAQRGLDDQAWDDVNFIDLDVADDFLEKATAIMNYEEYDNRVSIPVEFNDAELLQYMKLAHQMDITFNAFIELALTEALERIGNGENLS